MEQKKYDFFVKNMHIMLIQMTELTSNYTYLQLPMCAVSVISRFYLDNEINNHKTHSI